MELNNIKTELDLSIQNIDKILNQEDFSAYHQIKSSLINTRELLAKQNFIEAKKKLLLCIRLLMEAPTKDKKLGFDTLTKVDSVYKKISALLIN